MEAIETLMAEHQQILGAIGALEVYAGEVRRGGGDAAELGRFVTFIREFADAHHHAKEEDMLFAAMVEAGFPRDGRAHRRHAPRARPGARPRPRAGRGGRRPPRRGAPPTASGSTPPPSATAICSAPTSRRRTPSSTRWPRRASPRRWPRRVDQATAAHDARQAASGAPAAAGGARRRPGGPPGRGAPGVSRPAALPSGSERLVSDGPMTTATAPAVAGALAAPAGARRLGAAGHAAGHRAAARRRDAGGAAARGGHGARLPGPRALAGGPRPPRRAGDARRRPTGPPGDVAAAGPARR